MEYFNELREKVSTYLTPEEIERIHKAYLLGKEAHSTQKRFSGEPYITHPIAVAIILSDMRMDVQTIIAAILHDVIEDTNIDKKALAAQFGSQVAELVDGVSKLTQIKFESRAEAQAENFRKMILAVAKDLRVILIKLADRLHNMRTLSALPRRKMRRIALETLEIYSPIANRLGMHNLRIEFEELGFAALYPMRYNVLSQAVNNARGNRKEILGVIQKALTECLHQPGRPVCEIKGRQKHIYSIYKKMRNKNLPFSEIMDVYAFRIIVEDIDSCYRVLGAVHNLYKPVPERFKDYIAISKANGYQSLHTTLFGPYGVPIEVQIRSREMEYLAENGIAAHWLYKSDGIPINKAHIRAHEWLKRIVEMQSKTGNSLEFIENVKIDLFPDEVYVFTPKGNILELPNKASVVDFAYAIHTDIGNSCVAAKINRRITPLSTQLVNGQTVEIITSPGAQPNPAWLNFVITGKARSSIKHFLKRQRTVEFIDLGQRLIERALDTMQLTLTKIPKKNIRSVLKESHYETLDELFEATGLGHQVPLIVARRLAYCNTSAVTATQQEKLLAIERLATTPLAIKGTEGMAVSFATCCRPVPGDIIVGMLEAGLGITVHTEYCKNIKISKHADPYIFLSWEDTINSEFLVDLMIETLNRRGILAGLAVTIADADANIENIEVCWSDGEYSMIQLTLGVQNRSHVAQIIRRIRSLPYVNKVYRNRSDTS